MMAINIFHQLTNIIIVLRVWYTLHNIYSDRWVGIPHDLGIHHEFPAASKPASSSSHSVCVCVCVLVIYMNVGDFELGADPNHLYRQ